MPLNNGITKIPFRSVYTIIPFLACYSVGYLKPIMLEFYYVLAQGRMLGLQFDQFSQAFN